MVSTRKNSKANGYTLIELLLVVAVISLIAALGVKTFRDKAQSDRINIAALNIQHVLEAGMAYNVANSGLWPVSNSACAKASSTDPFTTDYLPNASNQSNFGTYLCWSGDDPTAGNQKAPLFWVAMPITDADVSAASDTARRIAARLPNAIITSNLNDSSSTTNQCSGSPCYVKAEVSVPSASSTSSGVYVVGSGNCDPNIAHGTKQNGTSSSVTCERTTMNQQYGVTNSTIANNDSLNQYQVKYQCRPNEKPFLQSTPNFMRLDRYSPNYNYAGKTTVYAEDVYQVSDAATCTSNSGQVTCVINTTASLGFQISQPATTIGCKNEYTNPAYTGRPTTNPICICAYPWNTANSKNPDYKGCPDEPGAVGASYVALCAPASSTTSLADQTAKSYW